MIAALLAAAHFAYGPQPGHSCVMTRTQITNCDLAHHHKLARKAFGHLNCSGVTIQYDTIDGSDMKAWSDRCRLDLPTVTMDNHFK